MIGLVFGALNFLVALPGYALAAITLWGIFTTPKGETRISNVLKTYAKVCSATLEAAWVAQRVFPAPRAKAQRAPFLGALPAAILAGPVPWLKLGGVTVAALATFLFVQYALARARDAGREEVRAQWHEAIETNARRAADAQEMINERADKIDIQATEKARAIIKEVSRGTSAIETAPDEGARVDAWAASVARLRAQGSAPERDVPAHSGFGSREYPGGMRAA